MRTLFLLTALATATASGALAQAPQNAQQISPALPSYGTMAEILLRSDLVIDATVRSAARIKGAEAANVPANRARFYIEADVLALIRGNSAIPPRVGYVVDVPLDFRGRPPKLNRMRVLLFARPLPQSGQIQLTDIDGQRPWTPELDAMTRGIVREILAPDAPPEITGVGNAFHVPGTLPGEGETQIFLTTRSNAPVSLQILRRPGEQPRWAVALGEIVDDAAKPTARDTLLWYRLACGLPRSLPESSVSEEAPENAERARADYQLVLDALGPCKG